MDVKLNAAGERLCVPVEPRSATRSGGFDAFRYGNGGQSGVVNECPMSTIVVRRHVLPCGGLPLVPMAAEAAQPPGAGVRHLLLSVPWEIDSEQPRPRGLPMRVRVRHYVNIGRMEGRLRRLLTNFVWSRMDRVFPDVAPAAEAIAP
jgi:hypothetical protein